MGPFTRPTVKRLRNEAETIGRVHAMQHLGEISRADLDSVVESDHFASNLRTAYDAAADEVGQRKAMKEAVKTARMYAEIVADVGGSRMYDHVVAAAEDSVRRMLGSGY